MHTRPPASEYLRSPTPVHPFPACPPRPLSTCRLNPLLPELKDEEDNLVQFRRQLLNKCQEEFEAGAMAMKAVTEREKQNKEKGEGEEEVSWLGWGGGSDGVCE